MTAKAEKAEVAAAAMMAAKATRAGAETTTKVEAMTGATATTKHQKWEQGCAQAVRCHQGQQK